MSREGYKYIHKEKKSAVRDARFLRKHVESLQEDT